MEKYNNKLKKEGLIKGKVNQHNNKSTRKWTGKLPDEVSASCEQPSQRKQTETPYFRQKATQKKQNKKRKGKGKKRKKKTPKKKPMVEHKTKSPAQKEAKASELHPWRLELDIFPSRLPWGHPHKQVRAERQTDRTPNFRRTGSLGSVGL